MLTHRRGARPYSYSFPRRTPTPADWGIGVTLCVAAVAQNDDYIVAASDLRVALGYTSGDNLIKGAAFHHRWVAMFAGDHIGRADPILEAAKQAFYGRPTVSRLDVEAAFASFMQRELTKRIEAAVLSPYNLTLSEFVSQHGRDSFPPEAYADIRIQMTTIALGCEFLVFGFDERGPHIFHVQERGVVDDHRRVGFWAIGSGSYSAIHHLMSLDYNRRWSLSEAAYAVGSAKYASERADLGARTSIISLRKDGDAGYFDEEPVRVLWRRYGQPRVPKNLSGRMPTHRIVLRQKPASTDPSTQPRSTRGQKAQPPSPE